MLYIFLYDKKTNLSLLYKKCCQATDCDGRSNDSFMDKKSHTGGIDIRNEKAEALQDFLHGVSDHRVWWVFSTIAIKSRFRRTVIGPLWITVSLLIWIAMLSLVNSHLFNTPVLNSLPHLIIGMIFWTLITSVLNECSLSLIESEGYLRNLPVSPMCYVLNYFSQNVIVLLFNLILCPLALALVISKSGFEPVIFLFFPGLIILLLNLFWLAVALSLLSLRFRDVPKIVNSFTQVAFFFTPVFWLPSKEKLPLFVNSNPLYHMLEIVRSPLLGEAPLIMSWCLTTSGAVLGILFMLHVYTSTFRRIRRWL